LQSKKNGRCLAILLHNSFFIFDSFYLQDKKEYMMHKERKTREMRIPGIEKE